MVTRVVPVGKRKVSIAANIENAKSLPRISTDSYGSKRETSRADCADDADKPGTSSLCDLCALCGLMRPIGLNALTTEGTEYTEEIG